MYQCTVWLAGGCARRVESVFNFLRGGLSHGPFSVDLRVYCKCLCGGLCECVCKCLYGCLQESPHSHIHSPLTHPLTHPLTLAYPHTQARDPCICMAGVTSPFHTHPLEHLSSIQTPCDNTSVLPNSSSRGGCSALAGTCYLH